MTGISRESRVITIEFDTGDKMSYLTYASEDTTCFLCKQVIHKGELVLVSCTFPHHAEHFASKKSHSVYQAIVHERKRKEAQEAKP